MAVTAEVMRSSDAYKGLVKKTNDKGQADGGSNSKKAALRKKTSLTPAMTSLLPTAAAINDLH